MDDITKKPDDLIKRPEASPLPATTRALLAQRLGEPQRTLNDMVEEVTVDLYDDKQFRAFLDATYDEQAVEGSLAADNVMAANMIREQAVKRKMAALQTQKLATINKALGVVLRRYQISRKQRRDMLDGQLVPSENNHKDSD